MIIFKSLKLLSISLVIVTSFTSMAVPEGDLLDAMMKAQSTTEREKNPTDPGRVALIDEMVKYPDQLSKDLNRISDLNIVGKADRLGDIFTKSITKKITDKTRAGLSALEVYDLMKQAMINVVSAFPERGISFYNPKNPQRIGPFLISEIIYALTQQFLTAPLRKLQLADPDSNSWQAEQKDPNTKLAMEIIFSPKNKTITVTNTSDKQVIDLSGTVAGKRFLRLTNSSIFNLADGSITYTYGYQFGKAKENFGPLTTPFTAE
jgi:hypothetical protein